MFVWCLDLIAAHVLGLEARKVIDEFAVRVPQASKTYREATWLLEMLSGDLACLLQGLIISCKYEDSVRKCTSRIWQVGVTSPAST